MPPQYSSSEVTNNNNHHIQDPLKPWKHIISPPGKSSILAPIFMRGLLAICIFAAFSLCFFSTFPGPNFRRISCPECDRHRRRSPAPPALIHPTHRQSVPEKRKTPGPAPPEARTNISHILFGIGGSAGTWGRRRHYCELWWKPNTTRGYVWLDEEPTIRGGQRWPETSPPYRVSGDTARFRYTNWSGSRSAIRIARIVKESFELGLDNVRWFVMGDDDTVFFTENLVNVLAKYDHKEMYYVGGNSESVEQDLVHSYITGYGGGGFAISRPAAAALVKILDGCIDRYADAYGSDQKIAGCMSEIGVPITKELGFHQLDIRGSPYGLLSTHPLAPLVTLHHLDYLHPLFPGMNRVESVKRLMQAYEADPARTLQHTFCYDPNRKWSISVSWGYSVQLYPFFVTAKDLSTPLQTFLTWGTWSQQPFTFNTRVMSLKSCERPIIYYQKGVERFGNTGNTLTLYRRPDPGSKRRCNNEIYKAAYVAKGFNVSAALLDPRIWNKAPRRQCCEVMSGPDPVDGIVQIRVRGCSQGESLTPLP